MASKPVVTHCDAGCKKEFTITKIRTRKVKGGVEKNYFRCPHCKREYITFYASAETLQLQKEMRKLHVSMRGKSGAGLNELIQSETALKALIKRSMDDARAIAEC
ncbi:hypothetical protein [Sporosarcina sp. FSL K6-3457]|uniref:hypothetical protein n=1 Tax=Sporosarcina sp. FSL K6-3457 TaxID=2978204 RepID=UPI0030F6EBFA